MQSLMPLLKMNGYTSTATAISEEKITTVRGPNEKIHLWQLTLAIILKGARQSLFTST